MNKSVSASNVSEMENESTPPNFPLYRPKRMREEDLPAEFNKFKDEKRELFTSFISTQQSQIQGIIDDLKEIQLTNYNIENSIALLTSQNEQFQQKIESLEGQTKKDREYILVLESKIEDSPRTSRKTSIKIKNVPKQERESTEDLINMILSLAKTINLDIESRDIKDIFRLQTKREGGGRNTPIIIELGSVILKNNL
ncbi:unnamed protein product [Chilo suppressalis]|uniref:Uncharacterized protein n=1 Tax=Chilo suppressalis TaxID=168631 RepID=A0ABN8B7L1_CHISP|nr:unnamed protein product [Chilo suppressalis]